MKTQIHTLTTGLLLSLSLPPTMAQNVGIGTTTPEQKLEIEGSGDQFVRIHTTTANDAGIELLRLGEFSGTDWKIINDGGVLRFYDGIDNFLTEGDLNMTLTQGGNLGLGTDAPQAHLHIAGTGDRLIKVQNTTFGGNLSGIDLLRGSEFNSTDWRIVNDGGTLKFLDGTDNFLTEGQLNAVITSAGNVGIGIQSPHAALHVVGSELISETQEGYMQIGMPEGFHLRFDNNEILARNGDNPSLLYLQWWSGNLSLCDNNAGRVGIGTSNPQAKLHITDGATVSLAGGGQLVLGPTSGENVALDGDEIQARNNGAASALFLQESGGDVLMVPFETGQVGIGITSSANMPSNDYLLAVDGKIISEEVRVEMSGSWPDYVFKDDYVLTPLHQLERQIKSLGHLPGIPPAATIENEGFDLGDMQKCAIEKIEELTLYLIAANKEIEALRNAYTELKVQLEDLQD